MRCLLIAAVAMAAASGLTAPAAAAGQPIWIVGSGAIQPFTTAVARRVAKATGGPRPIVERTGTTLAFEYLCAGTGPDHPNAASVTRRMTKNEFDMCQKNGVADIIEIPVGLDMLVIAQSKAGPPVQLTLAQMYLALARDVPGGGGALIANPHRKWSDIDRTLPDVGIDLRVLPPTSDTGAALESLFLQKGAERIASLGGRLAKDGALRELIRRTRGEPSVVVHEDHDVIVRQLVARPNALGVIGYRDLRANRATLRGVTIEGAEPNEDNAYAGRYPGTRKLYIYLRWAEVDAVPGLDLLGAEYLSNAALGPGGYLLGMGFMPLPVRDMLQAMELIGLMPMLQRDMLD